MGSSGGDDSGGYFIPDSSPTSQGLQSPSVTGGLQFQGQGMPLKYVPPTPSASTAPLSPTQAIMASSVPIPGSDNGQGLVNGAQQITAINPATQMPTNQTPGGLVVGNNNQLTRAVAPPPMTPANGANGANAVPATPIVETTGGFNGTQ